MKQKIKHNGQDIYFITYGKRENPAVIFLHGYLESSEIWDDFAVEFSNEYFVVCIDLPGHGDSETFAETQTMGGMAYAVRDIVESLHIKMLNLVGHSMGGYVAMAYRDKFPEFLNSYVLMHSTCFSDTDEKRMNRDREIELIRQGKKELIVSSHITKAFADSNLKRLKNEVEKVTQIALKTREIGIIAALKGMKMRADRCLLLVAGGIPLLLVAGKKDNYIPYETMQRMRKMANNTSFVNLEKSGHMGFIEEKEKAAAELKNFFKNAANQTARRFKE